MTGEASDRSPIAHRGSSPELAGTFTAAIDEVVRLTLVLDSAIARLAYADSARVRGELERALSCAQWLAEAHPGASERAEALRQLKEMGAVATQTLAIAPRPSSAAIAAAAAGDRAAWHREEQAWIAWRWASSHSLRSPRCRIRRRDTRSAMPTALRKTSGDVGAAISARARVADPSPSSDKADTP